MSTEDGARRGALRRYRRRSLGVVVVLAALGAGLAALNGAQGPRLSSAEVNARSVVERSGQRLVLHANQPLARISASQVAVSPAAPIAEVSTDGSALTVRFARPLRYAEEYHVQVSGTKGLYTGAAADLTWTFDTADPTVYSLVRAAGPAADGSESADRIFGHSLSAADAPVEVFHAPRIQEYAAVDSALAAVVLGPDDTPSLVLQSLTDSVSATVNTGSAATIRALRSSATAGMFGYVVSGGSGDPQNALFILDLSDPSAVPREIMDFSGRPFAVIDWLFVPGTTSVVVQATDHQVFVVDVLDPTRTAPFGSHGELLGFVPDSLGLRVADPDGDAVLDLTTGTESPLRLTEPPLSAGRYARDPIALDADRALQVVDVIDFTATPAENTSELWAVGPGQARKLYQVPTATSRIGRICPSPNGQYVAVEVIPGGSAPDDFPLALGYTDTTTYLVDTDDGSTRRGFLGFRPSWCD